MQRCYLKCENNINCATDYLIMFGLIIVLLILLAFGRLVFRNESVKGRFGEIKVEHILKRLPKEYNTFNNVYLQDGKYSSQIDHVIISPYGIFVIETKNYKGDIYGREKAEEWTQNIWGNKYHFRNPIKQNFGHVYRLAELFGLPPSYFTSIVVFTTRCDLYVNSSSSVIYISDLEDLILSYHGKIFEEGEVERLVDKLIYSRSETKITYKAHARYAKERKYDYQWKIENHICPKCGGRLVERNGRYGEFLGCCNFPRCRFTYKKI